jgi:hypothetical protein
MIIRNLPLHLADSARAWLEHLPANQIHDWHDLVETFVGNFQGTYLRPGTKWDLKRCRQKKDESLRDFIRRYSKRCTELPEVSESDVIAIFLEATTCQGLIHKLGRKRPSTVGQLLDIATKYASGDEAVAATSGDTKGERAEPSPAEGGGFANPPKKKQKGKMLQRAQHTAERDEDSDEALAAEPNRKGPRNDPRGGGVFDDMLKKPCPYHSTPVTHTLEQCEMLRKYYNRA